MDRRLLPRQRDGFDLGARTPYVGMSAQPKNPIRKEEGSVEELRSSGAEVDAFLSRVQTIAPVSSDSRGRLIFAMDATMSRHVLHRQINHESAFVTLPTIALDAAEQALGLFQ
jgi:hypothetical protein